jgi:hypothetical protein
MIKLNGAMEISPCVISLVGKLVLNKGLVAIALPRKLIIESAAHVIRTHQASRNIHDACSSIMNGCEVHMGHPRRL